MARGGDQGGDDRAGDHRAGDHRAGTIRALTGRFAGRTLPMMMEAGWDRKRGGHFERLDAHGAVVPVPWRRVMVHARQLYVFAAWAHHTGDSAFADHADRLFAYMTGHFWDRDRGGWFATVDLDGAVRNTEKTLYDHAFVLFGLAGFRNALGRGDAQRWIDATADVLLDRFSRADGSFCERMNPDFLDLAPERREQNPHMHLLEAVLALLEGDAGAGWRDLALRTLTLFHAGFLDESRHVVREHVRSDFTPTLAESRQVEAGHHFEWAWLLCRAACSLEDRRLSRAAPGLVRTGLALGWDRERGGILDISDSVTGAPLVRTKRLWPLCELVKALAVRTAPPDGPGLDDALALLRNRYLAADGRWTERFDADWVTVDATMPASSLYHLSTALLELERLRVHGSRREEEKRRPTTPRHEG